MPNRPSRTLWSIWDARPGSNDLLPVLPRHRRAQLVSPFGWAICGKPKSSLSPSRNRKFFNSVISRDENSLSLFAHSKTVAPARTLRLVSLLRSSERSLFCSSLMRALTASRFSISRISLLSVILVPLTANAREAGAWDKFSSGSVLDSFLGSICM